MLGCAQNFCINLSNCFRHEGGILKIAVQVRVDFLKKHGGDVSLAKFFLNRLVARGHEVELVSTPEELYAFRPNIFLAMN